MTIHRFPIVEDRWDAVRALESTFENELDQWFSVGATTPLPNGWSLLATDEFGSEILVVARPDGSIATLRHQTLCWDSCATYCSGCLWIRTVEVTLPDLMKGLRRGIDQRGDSGGEFTHELDVLRTALVGLYDLDDPGEAAEATLVALGGPVRVNPRALTR